MWRHGELVGEHTQIHVVLNLDWQQNERVCTETQALPRARSRLDELDPRYIPTEYPKTKQGKLKGDTKCFWKLSGKDIN